MSTEEWSALRLSLQVAVSAATAGLPFAVLIGYWLARSRRKGKWIIEAVVHLPLVLPPVVTGYLLLLLCTPRGPIGAILQNLFNVKIVFTWWAAAVASMVMSFPLMVRAIRLAFDGVDHRLEIVAQTLGANRLTAFFTVSLPLARRGIVAGWILAFARSLGEFGATIMVAGNIEGQTRTIPLAVYTLANQPDGMEHAWRLVALSVVLSCVALGVSELFERRRPHDVVA